MIMSTIGGLTESAIFKGYLAKLREVNFDFSTNQKGD
jgi:hypothetical protein